MIIYCNEAVHTAQPLNLTKRKGKKKMERNSKGMPVQPDECHMGDEATLFDKPLAYAYVPIQRWRMLYTPEDGIKRGTIFEELDKPMEDYGHD